MAEPNQQVTTPALNPPPNNDPAWLADTPASTDVYDVVLGNGSTTVGLMLFRGQPNSVADKNFNATSVDFQYAGNFNARANVGSGYGDDQQSFFMSFAQSDFSGGIGQKYFRSSYPENSRFWDCEGLDINSRVGQAVAGPMQMDTNTSLTGIGSTPAGTAAAGLVFNQMLYYTNTVGAAKGQDAMVNVYGSTATTVVMSYSIDGGISWLSQGVSSAIKWHDMADACVGDNGQIYYLESIDATTVTTSTIHHIAGPGVAVTNAWDNSTHITGSNFANCMCFWTGGPGGATNPIYVGTVKGQLVQATMGSAATGTPIKDFGGGTIISILATPKGIFVLYYNTTGEYKLFLYDGTQVSEVARLPKGWRYHYTLEQQLMLDQVTAQPITQHVMCYQDGVLYVGGMAPAADAAKSDYGNMPYVAALWYYASGNTGVVWKADTPTGTPFTGGSCGAVTSHKGLIYLGDTINQKLVAYNPATGSVSNVSALGTLSTSAANSFACDTNGTTTLSASPAVNSAVNSELQTWTGHTTPALLGSIYNNITHSAYDYAEIVVGTNLMKRNAYKSPAAAGLVATWSSSDSMGLLYFPTPIVPALIVDTRFDIMWLQPKPVPHEPSAGTNQPTEKFWSQQSTVIRLRPQWTQTTHKAYLATSLFDFDSSLTKLFRYVQWDGTTTTGDVGGTTPAHTESAGTVDLYYKLDALPTGSTDSNLVLIQTAAVPGTRYPINVSGHAISIVAVLKPFAVDASAIATTPIATGAVGPVVRKISVQAVPVAPAYRERLYQFALVDNLGLKNGTIEPRTPAQLRHDLETLLSANTTVTVSDAGVTGMSAFFELDSCKIREMRPQEYIAFVQLREI